MELGGGEKKGKKPKTKPKNNPPQKTQNKPEQNCITVIFPGEESGGYRNIGYLCTKLLWPMYVELEFTVKTLHEEGSIGTLSK